MQNRFNYSYTHIYKGEMGKLVTAIFRKHSHQQGQKQNGKETKGI